MERQDMSRLLLAGIVFLIAGCGSSAEETQGEWEGSVDTLASGRVVVHNPDVPTWLDTIRLRETVRIGSMEGEGPELFGRIAGLELGAEGEVYVLDSQASEIRVFGRDGAFLRAFGGVGEGPGELRNPAGLALDADETLWVLNWGNARYSGFDPATGEVRREVRRRVAFATFPWPGAFESGTRLVDVGLNHDGQPALLRLDTAFVPTDTLPLPAPSEEEQIFFRRGSTPVASVLEPFAPQPTWAPRPRGGVVLGEGAQYRLHRIGFDGDTSMTMELARERAPTTQAERDSALAALEEVAGALGGAAPNRRPEARGTKPAHGQLFVDDEDRTWVRSVVAAGSAPRWDVFASDGRFLGQVGIPVPPAMVLPTVRHGRMAIVTESEGYPAVVVYEIVGAGAG